VERSIIQFRKDFFEGKVKERRFLLHGEEQFLVRNFFSKLRETYPSRYRVLWGEETSPEELITHLSGGDLFGGGESFVVLKSPEEFFKKLKKKEREALLKRLKESPSGFLFLHFEKPLSKQDFQKEPLKSLLSLFTVVKAPKLPKEKVKQTVKNKFKKEGVEIEESALNYLLEKTGYDLQALKGEVEKLLSLSPFVKKITLPLVKEALFPLELEANLFSFVDAFFTGNYREALKLYENLLRTGYHPLQLQKLLSTYLLKLYALSGGAQPEKVGLKSPFLKHKFNLYLKRNPPKRLEELLERLWRADLEQKLYFRPPEESLSELLTELALKG